MNARSLRRTGPGNDLRANAADAARLLKSLGNENRLSILCRLVETDEETVSALADVVGLSQSALSQHLAKLRDEGIVATRQVAQTVFYRIADARAERVLELLHGLYCAPTPARRKENRA